MVVWTIDNEGVVKNINGEDDCLDSKSYAPFVSSKMTRIYIPEKFVGAYMVYDDKKETLSYGDGILPTCAGVDIDTKSAYRYLPEECQFSWVIIGNDYGCNQRICDNKGCRWTWPFDRFSF